ncbi:12917_t:CDS:2 [Dentiscutata heterogama]|uniref:12917_t:CDS:1 n=1 Tax=Dentiscutata heterogama TaxID=1316150 RepID=A0ACA9L3L7_9GLOM|nr:12917_t:CDS:2 [Dentiscutata heterogama]
MPVNDVILRPVNANLCDWLIYSCKNIENNKCMIERKFNGTIEKGNFENVGENSKISEGIIKGVIKTLDGTKTTERVIQGNFKGFNNNTFSMEGIDIENVSESEYQLWPVISDPSVF